MGDNMRSLFAMMCLVAAVSCASMMDAFDKEMTRFESRMSKMSAKWEKMAFSPMMRFPKMGKLPKGASMSVISGGSDRVIKMKDGKPVSSGRSFVNHKRVIRKNGKTLCQVRSKRSTTKNGK